MANKKFIVPMSSPLSVGDDSEKIGNLSDLTTTDKTNIVSSINEVNGKFPVSVANGGTGGTTATEARTSLGVMTDVQLYYNASGSSGTIELSESIENFKMIEICFSIETSDIFYSTVRVYTGGASSTLTAATINIGGTGTGGVRRFRAMSGNMQIVDNSLTHTRDLHALITGSTSYEVVDTTTDATTVYKVIGYKY